MLEKKIGYVFKEKKLLNKSLTHKSYANENTGGLKNNERFEFLGDSVLDLLVSEHMLKEYPQYAEGRLSKIRAAVVNEGCLADIAGGINLGEYLLLGKGEGLSGGRDKNSILANAFEALAGGVFLDGGLEKAATVFLPYLKSKILTFTGNGHFKDFKSELQEFTQVSRGCIPSYIITRESGPDHEKIFEVEVMIGNERMGEGSGRTKKEAEQMAAKFALEHFNSK
ncbi:MAG: ribonuclease III [Nitrospinales bacterium]